MTDSDGDSLAGHLRGLAVWVGYLLAGTTATALVGLAVLRVAAPVQRWVYRGVYLQLGPSDATIVAILVHIVGGGLVAAAGTALGAELLSDRGANARLVLAGHAVVALLGVAWVALALAGVVATPAALLVPLALLGVAVGLRVGLDVRSGAVPATVGAAPVVALFVAAALFGIGWGWGYHVVATEAPNATGPAPMDFEDRPTVERALFQRGDCSETADGRRVCRLQLRDYDREAATARYLARHGVRCPFEGAGGGTALARHGGSLYRVECVPHGD